MAVPLIKGKRITVFGLGLNDGGVGTVKFLAKHGAREIIVTDIKNRQELAPSLEKLASCKNVTYVLGQHRPEDFQRVDMVIKNPAIPWTNEYVQLAKKNGIPVEMDSSLFFTFCKAPIIGVTGSKGKTTTASLIAHILESAGQKVVRVGISRVGVLDRLERITDESVVVFELSSWRLSALSNVKRSPYRAVMTNMYPDHLNYYKSMVSYIEDKKNIVRFQKAGDVFITNFDNDITRKLAEDVPGTVLFGSIRQAMEGTGAWLSGETLMVAERGEEKILIPVADVPLAGEHNLLNVLLASLTVLSLGVSLKAVHAGIKTFPGVPHRLEKVAEKNGVAYYNDTTATIPDASIVALRSFTKPVILIAGGSDKQLEFSLLAEEILRRSKGLVLLRGAGTDKMIRSLRALLPESEKERHFEVAESMQLAVELATRNAVPGDVVLLSPGAASFGMFKNEFDRGEQFCRAVEALPRAT